MTSEEDKPKNHFPSLPARANQEAGLVPTPRYGRGSDLEVILEVIGSADRLPIKKSSAIKRVSDLIPVYSLLLKNYGIFLTDKNT